MQFYLKDYKDDNTILAEVICVPYFEKNKIDIETFIDYNACSGFLMNTNKKVIKQATYLFDAVKIIPEFLDDEFEYTDDIKSDYWNMHTDIIMFLEVLRDKINELLSPFSISVVAEQGD